MTSKCMTVLMNLFLWKAALMPKGIPLHRLRSIHKVMLPLFINHEFDTQFRPSRIEGHLYICVCMLKYMNMTYSDILSFLLTEFSWKFDDLVRNFVGSPSSTFFQKFEPVGPQLRTQEMFWEWQHLETMPRCDANACQHLVYLRSSRWHDVHNESWLRWWVCLGREVAITKQGKFCVQMFDLLLDRFPLSFTSEVGRITNAFAHHGESGTLVERWY